MFVLDTNVVSELIRPSPNPSVYDWSHTCERERMFFSTIGEAQLRYGIALMPAGRNKDILAAKIDTLLQNIFAGRILPFDRKAADAFAQLAAARRSRGLSVAVADIQIAAIAHSCGMSVATRDTKGFAGMGIDIFNPWTSK